MNIASLQPGEGVMRYKSVFALEREYDEVRKWFSAEMARLDRVADLAKAFVENDSDALAKCASSDLDAAKSDLAAMRREHPDPRLSDDFLASLLKGWRFASILRRYNQRNDEIDGAKSRSRRLNAVWEGSPYDGNPIRRPTIH